MATTRIDNAERARIFGPPCTTSNHRTYLTPWGIRVPVHFLVLPRFAEACDLAKRASSWVPRRIDGYNCRTIRDSTAHSIHSWAMAWDFFVTPPNVPPPGGVWTPDNPVPPEFAAAFERYGFFWGANFGRKDTPHIEWAGGRPDPLPATPPAPAPQEDDDMAFTDTDSAHLRDAKNYAALVGDKQNPRIITLLEQVLAKLGEIAAKP